MPEPGKSESPPTEGTHSRADSGSGKPSPATYYYPYTKIQEMCNALSMLAPSLVLAWHYLVANAHECFWHAHTRALGTGTLIHLPFSMGYHLLCAWDVFEDRVENKARKLDQTFIHVASVFYSFALSGKGSYCLGNLLLHGWYILRLWQPGPHDHPARRRRSIVIGVLAYTLPMAWRGDHRNFAIAFFGCWNCGVACASFNSRLDGWGHSLAHVVMGVFMHYLVQSAAMVPGDVCVA